MVETSDVVIVGGGVIGAGIAYELSCRNGLSVTLIDLKKPGNASQASAGGLWPIGESVGLGCGVIYAKTLSKDDGFQDASKASRPAQLPSCFFDLSLKSNALFPALHQRLLARTGIDFKLQETGLKFIIFDEEDQRFAESIYDSIPHLHNQIVWLDQQALRDDEPYVADTALGAMEFANDHQVNPYLLMQAYLSGARRQGVRIINEEVVSVEVRHRRVMSVTTRNRVVCCDTLVNAAGAWAGHLGGMLGLSIPIVPIKGQILLSETLPPILRSCLSTSDCYVAQKDNGEMLIGSTTEDVGFDTTVDLSAVRGLAEGAMRAVPALRMVNCKRSWAGLRPGTPDELPILGRVPDVGGYVNACGHFRTGILLSAVTASAISSVVQGTEPLVDITPFLLERGTCQAPGGSAQLQYA
jgi:hydrogen cyanide synthase HcnC